MMKHVTGISAVLACLGLGGLLSGFVPGPRPLSDFPSWRGEIRDQLYAGVPLSRPEEDLALQGIQGFRNSFFLKSLVTVEEEGENRDFVTLASPLLAFNGSAVSILTSMGPRQLPSQSEVSGPALLDYRHPSEEFGQTLEVAGMSGSVDLSGHLLLRTDLGHFLNKGPVCLTGPELTNRLDLRRQPLVARVTRYQNTVERYADKFGLDVPLVLAIIQTESGFNPNLISTQNAHGLMQVVPATAGGEVHRWLGRSGLPTSTELLSPDVNIRYGMTYMHLLQSKHLEGVRDPQSLEYCVIASYNGGSGAVLRLFGSTREAAVAAINRLSSQEVLSSLTEKFPARETRNFVRKVLQFRRQYVLLAAHKPAPIPEPSVTSQSPVPQTVVAPAVPSA